MVGSTNTAPHWHALCDNGCLRGGPCEFRLPNEHPDLHSNDGDMGYANIVFLESGRCAF